MAAEPDVEQVQILDWPVIKRTRTANAVRVLFMAAELGFEPRQAESETAVLPLHNSAIS